MTTAIDPSVTTQRVVARIIPSADTDAHRTLSPATPRRRRRRGPRHRWTVTGTAWTALLAILLTLMGWVGVTGATQRADANIITDAICEIWGTEATALTAGNIMPENSRGDSLWGSPLQNLGSVALVGGSAGGTPTDLANLAATMTEKKWGAERHTAYEWYGTAGLNWSSWYGSAGNLEANCFPMMELLSVGIANFLFSMAKSLTGMLLSVYSWATNPDLLNAFLDPIDQIITGEQYCEVRTNAAGERVSDCYASVPGLKDSLFLNFLPFAVLLGALWMLWNGLAKKRTRETWQAAAWTVGAAAAALAFMAQPSWFAATGQDWITDANTTFLELTTKGTLTSASARGGDICTLPKDAPEAGLRSSTCVLYRTFLYTPWAVGQYGLSATTPVDPGDLKPAVSFPGVNDLRQVQLDAQVLDHDEALEVPPPFTDSIEQWLRIKDVAAQQPYAASWAGRNGFYRTGVAFTALVAVILGGIVIFLICIYLLALKVGFMLLLVMAPLFLLLGVHPGMGRRIGLRWLEALLGTVAKAIVVGFLLAILMGMYGVILGSVNIPWGAQLFMLIAIGVAAIMYRKKLTEMLDFVNLGGGGGSQAFSTPGANQTGRRMAGAATGAAGGGAGGASENGFKGFIVGAATGATMSRYGKPGIASASRAYRSGKARAARGGTQTEQRDAQQTAAEDYQEWRSAQSSGQTLDPQRQAEIRDRYQSDRRYRAAWDEARRGPRDPFTEQGRSQRADNLGDRYDQVLDQAEANLDQQQRQQRRSSGQADRVDRAHDQADRRADRTDRVDQAQDRPDSAPVGAPPDIHLDVPGDDPKTPPPPVPTGAGRRLPTAPSGPRGNSGPPRAGG